MRKAQVAKECVEATEGVSDGPPPVKTLQNKMGAKEKRAEWEGKTGRSGK